MKTKHLVPPRIVVAGGGFAGLETVLYLRRRLGDGVPLTLVSDSDYFVFRPHLVYVPFGLEPEHAKVDLAEVVMPKNIRFVRERVRGVDPEQKVLKLGSRSLPYDYLVVATGARATPSGVPGLEEYAYIIWRESELLLLRSAFDHLARDAGRGKPWRVVFLVPPPSQWAGPLYELAFMLRQWLGSKKGGSATSLRFLTSEKGFMEPLGQKALHEALAGEFTRQGIEAQTDRVVQHVEEGALVLGDGERVPFDLLIASPTYRASHIWATLPTDAHGFLHAEPETCQVAGHSDIYAAGDGTAYSVKQAFLALLQADAAAEHLAARLLGIKPAFTFEPSSLWVMEQFEQALVAQVPLASESGTEEGFVDTMPPGLHQRVLLREHLPWQAQTNNPLYAGLLWKGTQTGWGIMAHLMDR